MIKLLKYLLPRTKIESHIIEWEKQKEHTESLECFIARKQTVHILSTLTSGDYNGVEVLDELEKINVGVKN